jgi:hypothetical protein
VAISLTVIGDFGVRRECDMKGACLFHRSIQGDETLSCASRGMGRRGRAGVGFGAGEFRAKGLRNPPG